MERSNHGLVVDTDAFKARYHDISRPALTHEQSQSVFGDFYKLGADGTPLLDPRAFEDPRCARKYDSLSAAILRAQSEGKPERPLGEKRAILATKLIVGAFVLSWLGSAAYEARDMEDRNPISNADGYAGVMFTGAVRYFDNYIDMVYLAQGKTPRSELGAQSLTQNSTPIMPTQKPTPTPTTSNEATASPTPSPSKSSEPINALYPSVDVIKYEKDNQGNILGMSATYKKESELTNEQVTQMEICGNTTKDVVLTFDDPVSEKQLDAYVAVLEEQKVGAIFFPNIQDEPKLTQDKIDELRKKGFWVGSHGGTHADLTELSEKKVANIIKSGGVSTLYRPAFGGTYKDDGSKNIYFDDRIKKIADNMGKNVCMWTIDPQDWKGNPKVTAKDIVATVKENVTESSVILLHPRMPETLKALPEIITLVRNKGLKVCTSSGPTSSDFSKTPICK